MTTMTNHSIIDRDFFIKIYGLPEYGEKSTLRSSRKFQQIIGDDDLFQKLVDKTYEKGLDKVVHKLRRGLTIIFYSK